MTVELGPHQIKAIEELNNGSILCGGTGSGKSRAALGYFYKRVCNGVYNDMASMKTPKDLYIITTAKKRDSYDWYNEAIKFKLGKNRDASAGGVKVTVDSWNNITKYIGVKDAFFIFDEQRLVGSGAWASSFIRIAKFNEWILLSATPGDTWLDYIPVFVANGFYKNRTEFKRRHVVYAPYSKFPKVDRYIGTAVLVKRRNQILVDMPYEKGTVRHLQTVRVKHNQQLLDRVGRDRWHVYENRPLRESSEATHVMRRVVNTDTSRLETLKQLLSIHPKLIVFYAGDPELEILRTLASSVNNSPTSTPVNQSSTHTLDHQKMTSSDIESLDLTDLTYNQLVVLETNLMLETSSSTLPHRTELPESPLDPLAGTIWEKGFDENDPTTWSGTSTQTSQSTQETLWCSPRDGLQMENTHSPNLSETCLKECEECQTNTTTSSPTTKHSIKSSSGSLTTTNPDQQSSSSLTSSTESSTGVSFEETRKLRKAQQTLTGSTSEFEGSSERSESEKSSKETSEPLSRPSIKPTVLRTDQTQSHPNLGSEAITIAELNGHKHEPIPTTDSWVYLVQYMAGAEAWNCIETDAMVFYSLTYSYKQFYQAQGRIDRLNTTFRDLHYYILLSGSSIDTKIMTSLKQKKDFNEAGFDPFT